MFPVRLDDYCKIILVMDNCSAHPEAETLVKKNVFAVFLLSNHTSVIEPMDQGILLSMKCRLELNL